MIEFEHKNIIYISGPFTHEDEIHGISENILKASRVALECVRKGWGIFCPHKNTADFQHVKDIDYETWIDIDLSILYMCDAIIMLDGWETSAGARKEHELARELNMPIYYVKDGIPGSPGYDIVM